jgi:hypothetical protein
VAQVVEAPPSEAGAFEHLMELLLLRAMRDASGSEFARRRPIAACHRLAQVAIFAQPKLKTS